MSADLVGSPRLFHVRHFVSRHFGVVGLEPTIPLRVTPCYYTHETEKEGFEPSEELSPLTPLAGVHDKPYSDTSPKRQEWDSNPYNTELQSVLVANLSILS